MADPVTLGVIAAAIVAAAIEKGADKAAGEAVDAADKAAHGVWGWVKARFGKKRELARLEETPDSVKRVTDLGNVIDAELVDDEASRAALEGLVDQVKRAAGPASAFNTGTLVANLRAKSGGVAALTITGSVHALGGSAKKKKGKRANP